MNENQVEQPTGDLTDEQIGKLWSDSNVEAINQAGVGIGNGDVAHILLPGIFARAIERAAMAAHLARQALAEPVAALKPDGRVVKWHPNYVDPLWANEGYRPLYLAAQVAPAGAQNAAGQILKGIGKIDGDGWKDVTRKGEVVFVWNTELPRPYKVGQFPRIGNNCGWSASTAQYDFQPATAEEAREAVEAIIDNHREKSSAGAQNAEAIRNQAQVEEWSYSTDEERYHDPEPSRLAILKHALAEVEAADDGASQFWIGRNVRFTGKGDAGVIIDGLKEQAFDECGEFAETYLEDVTPAEEAELETLVTDWAKRVDRSNFWTVTATECFTIEDAKAEIERLERALQTGSANTQEGEPEDDDTCRFCEGQGEVQGYGSAHDIDPPIKKCSECSGSGKASFWRNGGWANTQEGGDHA
jgi:hypothetical protein